tara:strand:- start:201 stop:1358 length:1158 start_codon:yes stop_codon:yes gene_type:complete
MPKIQKNADVVIIGGGVMGASTAYHLAIRGFKNILLLEKEPFFGTGATGRCAGGFRHQFNSDINIRLSQLSIEMIENFEQEIGDKVFVKKNGYLFVLTDEKDIEVFKKSLLIQQNLGVKTQWLSGDEVRRISFPCVFSDAIAGTYNLNDGIADPSSVVMGYIKSAISLGVVCITNCLAKNIILEKNKVQKLETNLGTVETEMIVNACGPWSATLGNGIGLKIPIFPKRRQWFLTEKIPEIPNEFPFVIDFSKSLYFHKEGEGILTGMSNHNQEIGEDQSIDYLWEENHIEAAVERMPVLSKIGIKARQAGLYELTPDAHPIIGNTPIKGFFILSGFSGHGFMHGPICGKLMSEIIIDGKATSLDISMLDYNRFIENRLILEYNVI